MLRMGNISRETPFKQATFHHRGEVIPREIALFTVEMLRYFRGGYPYPLRAYVLDDLLYAVTRRPLAKPNNALLNAYWKLPNLRPEFSSYGLGLPNFRPELSSYGLGLPNFRPELSSYGLGLPNFRPELSSYGLGSLTSGPSSPVTGSGSPTSGLSSPVTGSGSPTFGSSSPLLDIAREEVRV